MLGWWGCDTWGVVEVWCLYHIFVHFWSIKILRITGGHTHWLKWCIFVCSIPFTILCHSHILPLSKENYVNQTGQYFTTRYICILNIFTAFWIYFILLDGGSIVHRIELEMEQSRKTIRRRKWQLFAYFCHIYRTNKYLQNI